MTNQSKTYGAHINIAEFLATANFPTSFQDMLIVAGRVLPPGEARAWLQTQQVIGRKVYPSSASCKKPCGYSKQGCTGFDYQGKGCPGFETPEPIFQNTDGPIP